MLSYRKGPLGVAVLLDDEPFGSIKDCGEWGWQVRVPTLNAAQVAGIPVLRKSPVFDAQLEPTADALLAFQEAPGVFNGLDLLIDTNETLDPAIKFIAPAQVTCNYLTLDFENLASVFSENNGQAFWAGATALQPPRGPNSDRRPRDSQMTVVLTTAPASLGCGYRSSSRSVLIRACDPIR